MQITRSSISTVTAPAAWSTGAVYLDVMAAPSDDARVFAVNAHFAPAARTAWHTHPHGQTIFITEGVGLVQRRGGPVEVVHPGDRVFFAPGEEHWHGGEPVIDPRHVGSLGSRLGPLPMECPTHVVEHEPHARYLHHAPPCVEAILRPAGGEGRHVLIESRRCAAAAQDRVEAAQRGAVSGHTG
jgi:quercetin dioxygenase-like cupin family protein